MRSHQHGARGWPILIAAFSAVVLSACTSSSERTMPMPAQEPAITAPVANAGASDPVIPSPVYAGSVGDSAQRARVAELADVVEQLREDSTSGWQAHQDDANGYAGEVSGGRLPLQGTPAEAVAEFMDRYGSLFGPYSGLVLGADAYDDEGFATVWVEQVVGGVPVDGAQLVAAVRLRGSTSEVQSVTGRLVDTSGVTDQPGIDAAEAVDAVSSALGVTANPDALLLVTTHEGVARLAWLVTVESGPAATSDSGLGLGIEYPAAVFVDATDGAILSHRRAATSPAGRAGALVPQAGDAQGASSAIDYGNYSFTIPSGGRPIVIETEYLGGLPITVNAQQLPDGSIVLVDATGEGASTSTGKGVIVGLDGRGLNPSSGNGNLVAAAPLARYRSVDEIPVDALYAMWGARTTLDYLRSDLGMLSFDGRNSPVPIVYNYTEGQSCFDNAFFLTAPRLSHMAVGVPCADAQGNTIPTVADIDTIAHELGHGLIHSHTFTRSTIQQGALDEGLSDYLGLVTRNALFRGDSPLSSGDICIGFTGSHPWCRQWADGKAMRSANTGATFDEYAFTIQDALWGTSTTAYADSGHINSMIWTNALWQARRAVASLDGGDMATSERVRTWDRSVIRSATRWTPRTSMVDAAEAAVRSFSEAGATAQELNLVKDRFRANGLCKDCQTPLPTSAVISSVAVSTDIKSRPVALRDQVAYLLSTPDSLPGGAVATLGSPRQQRVGPPAAVTVQIAGRGTTVLQAQVELSEDGTRDVPQLGRADTITGRYEIMTKDVDAMVAPSMSATAYAWVGEGPSIVYQPSGGGAPSRLATGGSVAQVATSGDRVAFLLGDGRLRVWTVSTNTVRDLAVYSPTPLESFTSQQFLLPVGSLAMAGDRVAVVGSAIRPGPVHVFDLAANTRTTLSQSALPLGVTVNDQYVVWVEFTGAQDSPIFSEDADARRFPDTELRGYSFSGQQAYRMVDFRGQQAFPSLNEDNLLVWQESGNGNSDIYSLRLGTG